MLIAPGAIATDRNRDLPPEMNKEEKRSTERLTLAPSQARKICGGQNIVAKKFIIIQIIGIYRNGLKLLFVSEIFILVYVMLIF